MITVISNECEKSILLNAIVLRLIDLSQKDFRGDSGNEL